MAKAKKQEHHHHLFISKLFKEPDGRTATRLTCYCGLVLVQHYSDQRGQNSKQGVEK